MTTNFAPRNAENPYTLISTRLIRNPELRPTDARLMSILLSKPQGWQPNIKNLIKEMGAKRYAIQQAIKRLKQLGYLVCEAVRNALGQFLYTHWVINEIPAPPIDEKLDVHGNVIIFDNPKSRPKNLLQEAKNKASSTVKLGSKSASKPVSKKEAETSSGIDFDPYTENPHTGNQHRSNIDGRNTDLKILEREGGGTRVEEVPTENNSKQAELNQPQTFDSLLTKKEVEVNPKTQVLDQFSPTVALAKTNVEFGCVGAESACMSEVVTKKSGFEGDPNNAVWELKPSPDNCCRVTQILGTAGNESGFAAGYRYNEPQSLEATASEVSRYIDKTETCDNKLELKEFQNQLTRLGMQLGKRNPAAWAYVIAQNKEKGHCVYWEEFKSGIALGTSEQREWEVAPGIPCQIAVQCLEQDFLGKPGTTPQEAALRAARTVKDPALMKGIWESIKHRVLFQKQEYDRLKAIGVENPTTMESWMTPRPNAKLKDVAIALQEMQSALPAALRPVEERLGQEMLPAHAVVVESADLLLSAAVAEEDERAIGDSDAAVSEEEKLVAIEAKRKIAATLSKFNSQPKGKRAATLLAANSVDVGVKSFVPNTVVESALSSGGLSDYLLQLQVNNEDEIW
jgi:hypothetical protein